MGELKDLLQQVSESVEEQQAKKNTQLIIDEITNKLFKNAKQKQYHWVADVKTRPYYQEIYDFFNNEGFTIMNYKTELRDKKGKIIQERSFDIIW